MERRASGKRKVSRAPEQSAHPVEARVVAEQRTRTMRSARLKQHITRFVHVRYSAHIYSRVHGQRNYMTEIYLVYYLIRLHTRPGSSSSLLSWHRCRATRARACIHHRFRLGFRWAPRNAIAAGYSFECARVQSSHRKSLCQRKRYASKVSPRKRGQKRANCCRFIC